LAYAESALNMAASMSPSDPTVLSAMGRLARAQGKNRLAVQLLQQAQQVTVAQGQVDRAGPLGVNLVDYALPTPAALPSRATGSPVPLIPNPLGGRPVAPQSQTRPLMQSLPGYQQPVRAPSLQQTPAFAPQSAAEAQMRPVQYQLPRRESSVFDAPPAQPVTSAGPMLSPVAAQPAATYPSYPTYTTQPTTPAASNASAYYPTYPTAYPAARANTAAPLTYQTATPPAYAATPVASSNDLPSDPLVPSGWAAPSRMSPAVRSSASGSLQREIDDLRADRAGQVSGGMSWRGRSGDAGTSSLSDISTVIEGRFPMGDSGHLVLRMEPVFLSAGSVSSTDFNASQQFGTNALANVGGGQGTTREQQDSGMAISVGFETPRLKLDIGTTPLGFQVQNLVGGVAYNDTLGALKVKLDVSRRPVTDSLLSYAGTVDERTGTTWGGVTATGGRLEVGVEDGPFGMYGYSGMHFLNGKNVVSNSRFEAGAGAYYKFIKDTDMELTAGLNLTALGYKQNLRYFTLGHGGYFSPQRYFSLSLPVDLAGRAGKLAYRLEGSIGIQSFRENSVAYFPGDSALQAQWETVATANAVAAPTGVTWKAFYPGQSKTGLGFRLGAEAEYRLAPQWTLGGKVSMDNASNYTQTSGMVYVRYHFDPIYTSVQFPPHTLKVGQ
jgi:hypothetical protein